LFVREFLELIMRCMLVIENKLAEDFDSHKIDGAARSLAQSKHVWTQRIDTKTLAVDMMKLIKPEPSYYTPSPSGTLLDFRDWPRHVIRSSKQLVQLRDEAAGRNKARSGYVS